MFDLDSASNQPVDHSKLLSALRSERAARKTFEKAAKDVAQFEDRLQRVEAMLSRLVGDQRDLRAEVRRDLAPLNTALTELEDLGEAVAQLIREN